MSPFESTWQSLHTDVDANAGSATIHLTADIPSDQTSVEGATAATFGIADAIHLMRSLPYNPTNEHAHLIARVVGVTLGAVNVSIDQIVEAARHREKCIDDKIAALESHVGELEKTLFARRREIAAHESDLAETVTVREQLHRADLQTRHRPPPIPPNALRIRLHPQRERARREISKNVPRPCDTAPR